MGCRSVLCQAPAFSVIQQALAYYSAGLRSDSSHASDILFQESNNKYMSQFYNLQNGYEILKYS